MLSNSAPSHAKTRKRCRTGRRDAIICSIGSLKFDDAMLSRLNPNVRALGTYSVGHEHIDLPACKAAGIAVFNTPDVLADSVADAALLLILGYPGRRRHRPLR